MIDKRISLCIDTNLHKSIKDYSIKDQRSFVSTIRRILPLGLERLLNVGKENKTNIENNNIFAVENNNTDLPYIKLNINNDLYTRICRLSFDEKQTIKDKINLFIELEYINMISDKDDVISELPIRVNVNLDQLKKFNDMAKSETLPINKLMSVILNQYIDKYLFIRGKLCKEDISSFRERTIDEVIKNRAV